MSLHPFPWYIVIEVFLGGVFYHWSVIYTHTNLDPATNKHIGIGALDRALFLLGFSFDVLSSFQMYIELYSRLSLGILHGLTGFGFLLFAGYYLLRIFSQRANQDLKKTLQLGTWLLCLWWIVIASGILAGLIRHIPR